MTLSTSLQGSKASLSSFSFSGVVQSSWSSPPPRASACKSKTTLHPCRPENYTRTTRSSVCMNDTQGVGRPCARMGMHRIKPREEKTDAVLFQIIQRIIEPCTFFVVDTVDLTPDITCARNNSSTLAGALEPVERPRVLLCIYSSRSADTFCEQGTHRPGSADPF